jgi:hypothetical protein
MSAQGGTLARRGTVHLPVWPVAALLGAAVAVAIGMSTLSGTEAGVITSVTDTERFANSSAAVREQGATLPIEQSLNPGMWTLAQAESYLARLQAIESSTAAVREMGATLPIEQPLGNPGMWTLAQAEAYIEALEGRVTYAHGLENPGAYVGGTGVTYAHGLENPGAYVGGTGVSAGEAVAGPAAPHEPIVVNGKPCHQCI